jgi:prepilin-type N-terminal cleavage/methylation domain-containing protein
MQRARTSTRSGFTMVELAIVAVIMTIALTAVGLFDRSNRQTLGQSTAVGVAQQRAHEAIERVLHELEGASIATLVPDPIGQLGSDEIVFQKSTGVTATGVVVLSTRTRIALAMEDGETLDGADNNNNGLVDERKLTLTYDFGTATERTVTIAHRIPALFPNEIANAADDNGNGVVDERGFNLQRIGNLLSIRLAAQARGNAGRWVAWPENSDLKLRN